MSSDVQAPDPGENEGPKKKPGEILREEIEEGRSATRRGTGSLFLSGLSAGLDIGFGPFLAAVMISLVGTTLAKPVPELLVANMIAVGFVFVVLGRSELFTEQTTLAVLPLLDGKSSPGGVARVWAVVLAANLVGAAAFAWLAVEVGPALGVVEPKAFGEMAHRKVSHPAWVIFVGALLAGWLMGLLSWLVAAARDTISQIAVTWMIGAVIGFAHLPHAVAGSVEVLVGVFAGQGAGLADYGHFLLWSALGNAVGGPLFVAIIKYGHAVTEAEPA
jgi:formate/nitrite transporter FocA (FNT family)